MLYETLNPHGGEVYARKIDLDFSANINPLGLADNVQQKLQAEIASVVNYPEPYGKKLKQAIAVNVIACFIEYKDKIICIINVICLFCNNFLKNIVFFLVQSCFALKCSSCH